MRPRLSAQRVPVLQSQAGQSEEKQARGEQHLRLGVPLSLVATRHGRICHHCLQDLLSAPCRALFARVAVELLEGTALLMFSVELLFLGTLTLHTVLLCHIDIRQNIVRRKCPFSLDRPAALRAVRHGLRRCRP